MQSLRDRLLPFIITLFVLAACTSNDQKKQQEDITGLENQVIQIHDEVMPRMSDIARLTSILEIDEANSSLDSLIRKDISKSISELSAGDSLMWQWMHNYRKPENGPLDSIQAYLESEKTRIAQVRDVMLEAIKNAESLVQKLEHDKQK